MSSRPVTPTEVEEVGAVIPRRWLLLAVLPGALFGLIFIVRSSWVFQGERRFTLFDDAMISMSYARTMADGHGLVWYPGAPLVEGITNPLWTFVMSALHTVGLTASQISVAIMFMGLACVIGSAVLCARIVAQLRPTTTWAPLLAAFVASLCYPVLFWSLRGMEVGFLLLIALALVSAVITLSDQLRGNVVVERHRRTLAFAIGLVMIGLATRLDFTLIALVCIAWVTWVLPAGRRPRVAVPLVAVTIGTLAVMTVARLSYYDEITPNTYTLKVAGIPLVDRVVRGLITDLKLAPILVLAVIAALLLVRLGDARTRQVTALLGLIGISVVAYSTYVGGDAWEFMPNRYVAPLLVVTVILASTAIEALANQEVALSMAQAWVAGVALVLSSIGLSAIVIVFYGDYSLRRYFSSDRLVLALGVVVVLVAVIVVAARRPRSARSSGVLVAASALLLLALTGGIWSIDWVRGGGFAISEDQTQTERGLVLAQITDSDAVIATSFAGAPIYYSKRGGIDLLGKSDAAIASAAPRGSFFPGHNKWDYSLSVLDRRPDVVTEFARPPEADVAAKIEALYAPRCLGGVSGNSGIWVLKSSTKIARDDPSFVPCPAPGPVGLLFP